MSGLELFIPNFEMLEIGLVSFIIIIILLFFFQ